MNDSVSVNRDAGRENIRIHMSDDESVRYWCEVFSVSRERLEQAVNAVGPCTDRVQEFLAGGRM